jgi:hypothetical protein
MAIPDPPIIEYQTSDKAIVAVFAHARANNYGISLIRSKTNKFSVKNKYIYQYNKGFIYKT